MGRQEYETELQELQYLYGKVERMSEAKAKEFMNSDDSKQAILMYIQEDMDEIQQKIDELDSESEYTGGYDVDPAFGSWSEYWRMVI